MESRRILELAPVGGKVPALESLTDRAGSRCPQGDRSACTPDHPQGREQGPSVEAYMARVRARPSRHDVGTPTAATGPAAQAP